MKCATLVIMAAGIGSRFGGGIKQLEPVGPNGEIIMDYSIHDAIEAGFNKIVFVIRREIEEEFRRIIGDRIGQIAEIAYVYQEVDDIPEEYKEKYKNRTKPWGTGQAILCCRKVVKESFVVINADDYYGKEAFIKAYRYLSAERERADTINICMIGFVLKNTLSDNGGVTRGICMVNEEGMLENIVETHNIEKRGNKAVVFYAPRSGNYIGWIRQYNNRIILSLNSGIYRMSFLNKYPILLKKVDNRDKNAETKGALWSLIYIGRFIVNKNGWLSYYTTDFHGVRRGNVKIFLGRAQQSGQLTKSGRKIIQLQAGQIKQLATIHMHDRGLRTAGWTSANPSIVSIDNNGYMKAKRSGKTYISTRINGRKRAFRVKVSGYTITYKNVGINSSKNREMLSGKRAVTLRSPRKKGYTFVGWYDSSGKNVTVIPKGNTKNLILHAKWDKTSSKDSVKAK